MEKISERRLYQKVTDIFATAIDYNKDSERAYTFFKTVQNKLHYSVTGNTAAEIIYNRADASKKHMGLKTWERAPRGRIHSTDVVIAKNYLEQNELKILTQLVTMFLDFAETMATKNIPVTMNDYIRRMDALLELNGRDVLDNPGKVSHEVAEKFALSEFEKYKLIQEKGLVNDFDLFLESPELKEMPILDNKYKEKLKTLLGQEVCGVIDRPIGSRHPKYEDIIYQVNYGYINELTAPDGEKQDAYFLGIKKPMKEFKGVVIAIIDRIDDIEDELKEALEYHSEEITAIKDSLHDLRYETENIQSGLDCRTAVLEMELNDLRSAMDAKTENPNQKGDLEISSQIVWDKEILKILEEPIKFDF